MVAAKRVRTKITAEYGIRRIDNVDGKGHPVRHWCVILRRQGQEIVRQFFDGIYGDEKVALTMARAYRDAALRLFPPLTQHQLSIKPRSTNTSGTPGVHAIRKRGELVGWKALVEFQGHKQSKSFFTRDYGEERAKALAVAERMHMLQSVPNRFATVHPHATDSANEQFANVLEDVANAPKQAAALFDPVAMQKLRQALDAWFDALKPQQVHVRVKTYLHIKRGHLTLSVTTSDGGGSARLKVRTWSLLHSRYEERLSLVWDHIRERLTELLGEACWRAFERDHRLAFFASNSTDGFYVHYRYDRPDGDSQRLLPPPELLPMLEGFVVPALPVSRRCCTTPALQCGRLAR